MNNQSKLWTHKVKLKGLKPEKPYRLEQFNGRTGRWSVSKKAFQTLEDRTDYDIMLSVDKLFRVSEVNQPSSYSYIFFPLQALEGSKQPGDRYKAWKLLTKKLVMPALAWKQDITAKVTDSVSELENN
ncbi:hypothetical protein GZ77_16610 [Endozoicomonas montiporae]|uniref:Uncharacterized protein n=2 Tax=Endozoicomonas montiporae TaxID=1027273 RepID=A0A081N603_9GAMM|nr:hypothetical protein [Endozoicomonas montiporae]AMO57207.1 hypothetical protein EZMO1_3203 [Endozoicomonas montiporae CL-33]KEQ13876.1 hypothetical protein GZ77_16610 [Endozoicomonas montiporae]